MDNNRAIFEFSLRADKQDTATVHSRTGITDVKEQSDLLDYMESLRGLRNEISIINADENNNLGSRYAHGLGVEQDEQRATEHYRMAAEYGHDEAQYNLGCAYEQGNGVVQDDAVAMSWLSRAAEQGNAQALTNLGLRYAHGQGVEQNMPLAIDYFCKAAEQGSAAAQANLG